MSINVHQNLLIMQRKRQIYILDQMSKEWEGDHQVTLQLLLAFYYVLFTSVSQVDFSERIVSGGQDLFGAFIPKCNTQQMGIGESNTGKLVVPVQELMKPLYAFKKPMGCSSCEQWLLRSSGIDPGL